MEQQSAGGMMSHNDKLTAANREHEVTFDCEIWHKISEEDIVAVYKYGKHGRTLELLLIPSLLDHIPVCFLYLLPSMILW